MKKRESPADTWGLMRSHPKELLFVLGMTMGGALGFYVFSNYMQKFLVNTSGFSRDESSLIMAMAMIVFMVMQLHLDQRPIQSRTVPDRHPRPWRRIAIRPRRGARRRDCGSRRPQDETIGE